MRTRSLAAATAAALVFSLAPATSARAEEASLTGTWGTGCATISVTSAGQPAGATVHVRWYGANAAPLGEELVPANTTWTLPVDPAKVRGFSYRLADAEGTWLTPLQDQAASCVVVVKPTAALDGVDCDTLHVTAAGLPLNEYAVGGVRVVDETGAVVAQRHGAAVFDFTAELPNGHTYRAEAGFTWTPTGQWHTKATSAPADLTTPCPQTCTTERVLVTITAKDVARAGTLTRAINAKTRRVGALTGIPAPVKPGQRVRVAWRLHSTARPVPAQAWGPRRNKAQTLWTALRALPTYRPATKGGTRVIVLAPAQPARTERVLVTPATPARTERVLITPATPDVPAVYRDVTTCSRELKVRE